MTAIEYEQALARLEERLTALARRPFRARFRLAGPDRATVLAKGLEVMRQHAADLIGRRLAPARPLHDGKQTPFRGYPVFMAQHATATCCRGCLERWHGLAQERALDEREQQYVVAVILAWMERQLGQEGVEGQGQAETGDNQER